MGFACDRVSRGALLSGPMPKRRGLKSKPSDYLGDGDWPTGTLRELTDEEKNAWWTKDVPAIADFFKKLAMKLHERHKTESIYKMANDTHVSPQTITNYIRGETWGDVVAIFRLEQGLKEALWSHDHLPPPPQPRDHLADGGDWPDGELKPGTPPHVHFTKQLAVELQEICDNETVAAVADRAGCDTTAIKDFLTGKAWADIETIFRVEHALNTRLWRHDHLWPPWTETVNDSERV